jgi:hypothetical protein
LAFSGQWIQGSSRRVEHREKEIHELYSLLSPVEALNRQALHVQCDSCHPAGEADEAARSILDEITAPVAEVDHEKTSVPPPTPPKLSDEQVVERMANDPIARCHWHLSPGANRTTGNFMVISQLLQHCQGDVARAERLFLYNELAKGSTESTGSCGATVPEDSNQPARRSAVAKSTSSGELRSSRLSLMHTTAILELGSAGLRPAEIARKLGVAQAAVCATLADHKHRISRTKQAIKDAWYVFREMQRPTTRPAAHLHKRHIRCSWHRVCSKAADMAVDAPDVVIKWTTAIRYAAKIKTRYVLRV